VTLRLGRSLPALALLVVLASLAASGLAAQDTTAVQAPADTGAIAVLEVRDTTIHPIKPMNALWRSLLLPGWGQARLGRKLTAGILIAWEGTTLGMSLKTRHELAYLRRTDSQRADDKRREHEDWLVLLGFNHLFAGLEAYVSAHLSDFPADLHLQAVPGGFGGSLSVPIRIR
jgi:hypothetical protein